jgi:hypothetical protein
MGQNKANAHALREFQLSGDRSKVMPVRTKSMKPDNRGTVSGFGWDVKRVKHGNPT